MNRKLISVVMLLAIALALAACAPTPSASTGVNRAASEEVVSASFTADKPTIIVETFNGNIDISVIGGNAIKVDVSKRGSGDTADEAKADLKNIQVTMNQEGSTVHVTAQRTDKRTDVGNSGASARVTVPPGSILQLRTSNGKVTTSGEVADVTVQNSNGAIDVRGATGALDLKSSNGDITSSGGSGKLKVANSNGVIDVTSTSAAQVDISNANGVIRFNGPLTAKSKNSLRNSNADVAVTLPAAASFTLNATTSNGKITSDFVISGDNKNDQQLKGTVGQEPQTSLTLTTSNADIELHKGN